MNKQDKQRLKKHIDRFELDTSDEHRSSLLKVVRKVDPKGYDNLMKCQCAYEFHMILEAILNP